jgi:hypothetical protein
MDSAVAMMLAAMEVPRHNATYSTQRALIVHGTRKLPRKMTRRIRRRAATQRKPSHRQVNALVTTFAVKEV